MATAKAIQFQASTEEETRYEKYSRTE